MDETVTQKVREIMQPELDEIEEYANIFDIPPYDVTGKFADEIINYLDSVKMTIEKNRLEVYDEPFSPLQENGAYTVSVHNAYTNETEVIGYDNESSYTFAIDEYKAFVSMEAALPQSRVTSDPIISKSSITGSVINFANQKLTELGVQHVQIIDAVEYAGDSKFGTNILLEYKGDLREDDFFSLLHESDFTIDGKKIDINPITATKSGTIKQYLEALRDNEDGQQPNRQTSTNRPSASLRTKQETIDYFKHLSYRFGVEAHRNNDLMARAKAEAYELAAFELERNMVGDINLEKVIEKQHSMEFDERNDKPLVYVCSPLAGEIEENIRKAREYSKFVAFQGNTPIAPHITELFNDTIPEERELGLSLGIDYLHKANELWMFGDRISNGMANEIKIAHDELEIPIYSVSENMNERRVFDYKKFLENEGGNISMATSKSAPLTNEQIELAKKTNLFEYVQARYQVKPHGAGTYCIVEGEHDSVILFPETNTWYDFRNEKGGDPVSFLMHHEQKEFIPAVKELLGELTDPRKVFYQEMLRPKERQPMALPPHDENNNRVFAYLIKTRGIERDIVKQCVDAGTVYQSKEVINKGDKTYTFSNCIFVGRDVDGNPRYASQRSMNDNSPYVMKTDVRNSDKHFGFCIGGSETTEWVTICEAPIDAMSYASINKMNGNFNSDEYILSLGGVGSAALGKFLETHQNIKTINIALDNDRAGRTAGETIKATYVEKGYTVLESYPDSKDHNQDLQILRQRAEAPFVEIPAPSAESKTSFMQLTQTKLIDKDIVADMISKGDIYQIDKEIETANGEKKISTGTIFVRKNEFGDPLYAMGISHTSADKPEFKIEYINEKQTGCFLFHKGQNDTLFVFNNPVSMLSYQTIQKAMGQPIGHCVCSMTRQDDAIAEYMNSNKDVSIKRIDVMMDKSNARDTKTQQPYDYRAMAFDKINTRFSKSPAKIKVTKHYPTQPTLNQDLVKAVSKNQTNPREKTKENDIEMDQ